MLDRTEALAMLKASAPDHLVVHALETEAVMRALAAHMGRDPETWGLAGLLHDLGKIPFGDEYAQVLARVQATQVPLVTVEQQLLDLDHEEVGAMIAAKWKLNAVITDAICHHHAPELAAPGHRDLVATVALADFYVCLFDIGDAGNRYPDPSRLAGLLEQCRLHWGDIVDLAASVEAEIRKAEIFLQI